jgi:hypothetical protein
MASGIRSTPLNEYSWKGKDWQGKSHNTLQKRASTFGDSCRRKFRLTKVRKQSNADFHLPKPLSIEYGLSPINGSHQAIDGVESINGKTSHIDEHPNLGRKRSCRRLHPQDLLKRDRAEESLRRSRRRFCYSQQSIWGCGCTQEPSALIFPTQAYVHRISSNRSSPVIVRIVPSHYTYQGSTISTCNILKKKKKKITC